MPLAGAGVWTVNAPTVDAWLEIATQWRTGLAATAEGVRTLWVGLDYGAARVALDAAGIAVTPQLWRGLREMELAARAALNGR